MNNDRMIRGAKLIGRALGVSESTARRWYAKGIIPAHKMNGKTSPLTIRRSDIERLKRPPGAEE
jgi:predicted site-specific integrase-resolvase